MKEQLELLKDYLWYYYDGDIRISKWFDESPMTIKLQEHFGIEFYKMTDIALELKYHNDRSQRIIDIANRTMADLGLKYEERDKMIEIWNKLYKNDEVCVACMHFSKIKKFSINLTEKGEFASVEINNFKFRLEKPKVK